MNTVIARRAAQSQATVFWWVGLVTPGRSLVLAHRASEQTRRISVPFFVAVASFKMVAAWTWTFFDSLASLYRSLFSHGRRPSSSLPDAFFAKSDLDVRVE